MKTMVFVLALAAASCEGRKPPTSTSGVRKAQVAVEVGSNGLTVEQENIARRLKADNTIGSIKHLYVISAYSGQVIFYSTVKGKITSGNKRLTPGTVAAEDGTSLGGIPINIGGET